MWEYKTEGFGTISPSAEELNTAAVGGWRLATVVTARNRVTGIFEREVHPLIGISTEPADPGPDELIQRVLDGADIALRNRLLAARSQGTWNGSFLQLIAIADDRHFVNGIGKTRQAQLAELISGVRVATEPKRP